jgi:beta-glucosidase
MSADELQATGAWSDASRPVADRVEALLAEMTLEEKAGQLGSFWPRQGAPEGEVAPMEDAFATRPFEEAAEHGLGHLTRVFGSAPVSVAEGAEAMRSLQRRVRELSPHGIPAIAHEECLTGFTAYRATVYPTSLAWGATFDPGLVEEMAARIGHDMASVGVHQGLSPVVDVVHDYRWGRVEETIGEDPYLVGMIGTAYVRGLQSAGVVATVKHFAGYSASLSARNHAPVQMGRRHLSDVVLQPFEMAVREAGVGSVMNSYSDLDGVPPASSRELLTAILRDDWGFRGTVVSDYWAISFLELAHRVAGSPEEAARLALPAGLDVELPETHAYYHLPELVRAGAVSEQDLDTAVRRVLTQKAELGLLDEGWEPAIAPVETVDLDSADNRALAARIAERSLVLLSNDGTLPVAAADARRICVIGPSAAEPRTMMGCYAFPNHVLSRYEDRGTGVEMRSILDALTEEYPDADVVHVPGCAVLGDDASDIPEAVSAAESSDLVVLTVGDLAGLFGRGSSGEGCDAPDLALPGVQGRLVEAVVGAGTPVVLVVVSGRPYALGEVADRCAAVVQAFFPGEEGAAAIAGVLSGRVNPSGHLPVGVPRLTGGQPSTYLAPPLGRRNASISNLDPEPLFPFGHGLSYTSFEVADLDLSADRIPPDGTVEVSVTVANTGERPGAEVVQLYLSDHVAQVTRPVRELVGFARVDLEPGRSRRVTFHLHADRTSFTGADHRRVVEPGMFTLAVGTSSEDLPQSAELTVEGELRVLDGPRVLTTPVTVADPSDQTSSTT